MRRRSFRAMGTEVELLLAAAEGEAATAALDAAEREVRRLERLCSRFDPGSALTELNRTGSLVSAELAALVRTALAAREQTGGLFDPTVHDAVRAAGYDRSFEAVPPDGPGRRAAIPCGGEVTVDRDRVVLAPGVRLDLGGIAKGYAVDRACALLAPAGPCLVNAGGDLAVHGASWPVGLEGGPTLALAEGAVATSGRDRRRWRRSGEERHHLIDPRTGRPADTVLLRVTVVASTAVEAEVLAKAAFLGAPIDCPRVLVTADGRTVLAGGLS
jgi:thiamine biosynthesis lipoprotein